VKFLPIAFLFLLTCFAHAQTPIAEMEKWVAALDATWQETYAKEVTAPFDAEMAKLAQQYLAALDANIQKASTSGDLDQTVGWRAERERFALAKDVPAEDEATAPVAFKQLRASWRAQAARLQKDRATRAAAVLARYDAVLSDAQKKLTQQQRIDEALLVKKQRDQAAARWTLAAPPPPALAAAPEPPRPATPAPAAGSTATSSGPKKATQAAALETLLAMGAQVRIDPGKPGFVTSASEAPAKFAIIEVVLLPRTDGVPITDADLAVFENLYALRVLRLKDLAITDAGLQHVAGLRDLKLVDLRKLENVAGPGYKFLGTIVAPDKFKLEQVVAAEAAIKAAAANRKLTHLELRSIPTSDAALAAFGAHPALAHVELGNVTGLTATGVAQFARAHGLVDLLLKDFEVDDALAVGVGAIQSLHALEINRSKLTDAGLLSLSRLRNLSELRIVNPPVTPEAIAALKKMPALKVLVLLKPTPPEDVAALKAALKGVQVKN
jgi:hypothetical protein